MYDARFLGMKLRAWSSIWSWDKVCYEVCHVSQIRYWCVHFRHYHLQHPFLKVWVVFQSISFSYNSERYSIWSSHRQVSDNTSHSTRSGVRIGHTLETHFHICGGSRKEGNRWRDVTVPRKISFELLKSKKNLQLIMNKYLIK